MKNLFLGIVLATIASPVLALETQEVLSNSEVIQNALESGIAQEETLHMVERAITKGKIENHKALLVCGRFNTSFVVVNLEPSLCEIFDLKTGNHHTLMATGTGIGWAGYNTPGSSKAVGTSAGIRIGYVWGKDYKNYLTLTKHTFHGIAGEFTHGLGGEGGYLGVDYKDINVGFAGVIIGESISLGMRRVKFFTPKFFFKTFADLIKD